MPSLSAFLANALKKILTTAGIVFLICHQAYAQEPALESSDIATQRAPSLRTWATREGQVFNAALVEIQKDTATLDLGGEIGEKTLSLGSFTPEIESELKTKYFAAEDEKQLNASASFFSETPEPPAQTVDELKRLHLAYGDSPYAGLWAGAMLASKNQAVEASGLLRQVISRIKRQQKYSPYRHATTLHSAINNLAVCMFKTHQFESAAGLFAGEIESALPASQIVRANASKLARSGVLESKPKNRLDRAIAAASSAPTSTTRLKYDLTANAPTPQTEFKNDLKVQPPGPYLTLSKSATGIAISNNTVICKPTALGLSDLPSLNADRRLSVAIFRQGKGWESIAVSSVDNPDPSLNLLLLKISVPKLSSFNTITGIGTDVPTGSDIAVLSFGSLTNTSENISFQSVTGTVAESTPDGLTLAGLPNGSQGPVINRKAQLIGLLASGPGRTHHALSSTTKLRVLVDSVNSNRAGETRQNTFADLQRACVMVLKWDAEQSGEARLVSELPAWSGRSFATQDNWCLPCKGTSFVTCGVCTKGVVRKSKRVKVAVNTLTGEPIFANKAYKEKCPSCKGTGGFDCRGCYKGKLRP